MMDCFTLRSVDRAGSWMTCGVLVALLLNAEVSSAQATAREYSIAAGAHADIAYITDHTTAPGVKVDEKIGRRGAGGGAARRNGFGIEIAYDNGRRTSWVGGLGFTTGRTLYRQQPGFDFTPPNIHSIMHFNTQRVAIGRRWYLRSRESKARAFYEVQGGYEQFSARLFYSNVPTDTLVKTAGPMGQLRAGSQLRLSNAVVLDLALQVHYASYRGWTRSGTRIAGDPTNLFTWTVLPALRVRL